jgi:hypothetical protein
MHILAASLCRCRAFTHLFLVARSRYCIFFTFQEIEAVLSFKFFFYEKVQPSFSVSRWSVFSRRSYIQGGPDITCQKNSGSLERSNKSKKPPFVRSKIMKIN